MLQPRRLQTFLALGLLACLAGYCSAAEKSESSRSEKIDFTQEVLPNGLRVIYAPLHQAPVVHVRVLYHVGSRDEKPDRQGFAHMFEHMMFRGSAHVKPEEHMKLIGIVGGNSNAFTSFDQTVYVNTIPASALDMTLYLEADRMASFKVSDEIFKVERKVVAEEWRIQQNRPYGNLYEDLLKNVFTSHSYRWTPIGNMDHLRAARVTELQDFFNTYYLPGNATLVIAGDIDVPATKQLVSRYFGWIPKGPDVHRDIPQEPQQEQSREATVNYAVPLPAVMIAYPLPAYRDNDHDALELLAGVLGGGRSSRLDRLLVNNADPQAVGVYAEHMKLEDAGIFAVGGTLMQGKDPARLEKVLRDTVAEAAARGVSQEELDKAKTEKKVSLVVGRNTGRETATDIASQLGEEALFGGDANRVNTALARIDAVTLGDLQRVAQKYLRPERSTTLRVHPDPLGQAARAAATQQAAEARATANAPVAPADVKPRVVAFPPDYPTAAKLPTVTEKGHFAKGEESEIGGVKVIVMSDHRLPFVSWSLTTRQGSYADPKGKEGLSGLAADMLRRGAGDLTYDQLNQDLESRGISLEITDGGDHTRLTGSCLTQELDHAMQRTKQVLLSPTFPEPEFRKLLMQSVGELQLSEEDPRSVATHDLAAAIYPDSPLGRHATPKSVQSITLDDVKKAYARNISPAGAILIVAGDVTVERGRELAKALFEGWKATGNAGEPAPIQYPPAPVPAARRIILVDRPSGKQSTIRMGIPAYDIHTDEKFAGSIAGQILTAGIDSRLGRYVRAEKGLAYGVHGVFQPGRHGGEFIGDVDTAVETSADAITAMFHVFDEMANGTVTPEELTQARMRVSGGLIMQMQTIQQQAGYRVDGILNGYPIDYYDLYPQRVAQVTADQVREVVSKYVKDGQMTIVVVGPAEQVKDQLKPLGEVKVVPMPAKREGAATQPSRELLKPAA